MLFLAAVVATTIVTMLWNGFRFISNTDPKTRENATRWIVGSTVVCAVAAVLIAMVAA